ncbi:MAG: hypothetical protein JJT94_02385 [Bernardetiaceae bacterium]|nr:hypothetical protein [Bernardetiaceae bacterium]
MDIFRLKVYFRNALSLFFVIWLTFGLSACEEFQEIDEKSIFLGEWKIVSISDSNIMKQAPIENKYQPLEDASITFRADGTYLQSGGTQVFEPKSGTWSSFEQNRKITFNKQTDEEFVVDVAIITKDNISLRLTQHLDVVDADTKEIRIHTKETFLELGK